MIITIILFAIAWWLIGFVSCAASQIWEWYLKSSAKEYTLHDLGEPMLFGLLGPITAALAIVFFIADLWQIATGAHDFKKIVLLRKKDKNEQRSP